MVATPAPQPIAPVIPIVTTSRAPQTTSGADTARAIPLLSQPDTAQPSAAPEIASTMGAPAVPRATGAPQATGATRAGIALILPTKAPAFARAAEVTRAGFIAARNAGKDAVPFTLFETDGSPERARAAYREAAAQALVVVGPLTRSEVGALIGESISVPTLVLNLPEPPAGALGSPAAMPQKMRALALNIEQDAQSAAHAMYGPERQSAVVVTINSALQKRAAAAFTDAWIRLGGQIGEPVEYSGSLARVRQGVERAKADIVFLAADAANARLLRPYLGRNNTVIATSQVYSGAPKSEAQKFHDMNGIRFIDLPWLHLADRASLGFAQPDTPLSPDLDRLYALGIDAYRVARELVRGQGEFDLDGVTGKLRVLAGSIEREPMQAEFRDGEASPVR